MTPQYNKQKLAVATKTADADLTSLTLPSRLALFFKTVRPHLEDQRSEARVLVDPTQVKLMLAEITPALSEARAAGAFMNIWNAAGLKRNEVRNAAVLAWLLDPRGTHGLSDSVAKALFARILRAPEWLSQQTSFDGISVVTEEHPVGSSENRVDVSIAGPTFLIFIEVKIDAPEGLRQVDRYRSEIDLKSVSRGGRHTSVIFLTRHGKPPANTPDCASLAWRDVEQSLETVARNLSRSDGRRAMLMQFAEHIRSF